MNHSLSLRWRLPLSYGAIALLATLSLGIILLTVLSRYYALQERRYLLSNAQAIGSMMEAVQGAEIEPTLFQTQIDALSSLTQTQIQVFDENGRLLANSGTPDQNSVLTTLSLRVESGDAAQEFSQTTQPGGTNQQITSSLALQADGTRIETITTVEQGGISELITPLSILETPYSFGLGVQDPSRRSNQVVNYQVRTVLGEPIGTVEISQGPAFGLAILTSVAWGVGISGALAVSVATLAGWWASRRLTAPLTQLATAANQMAAGELKTRTAVQRRDEIGELAIAFNQMATQLEGLVGTLRHFVADAAHEMRTPLTALRTNLELAADSPEDGRFLKAAQAQLNRIQQLTDDLLQLSQLENEAELIKLHPLDLTELLQAEEERYATMADQAGLEFQLEVPKTAVNIQANPTALLRAVDNLIDNSVKFTLVGGCVQVALQKEGKAAVLTIEDSGIGLDSDSERLFSRFYRGRNAAEYPGSGLGLAITKAIVEAHNGRIQATSLPKGTRMTLYFPIHRE